MFPHWIILFPLPMHWMASLRLHSLRPSPLPKGYETLALWLVYYTYQLRHGYWCLHPHSSDLLRKVFSNNTPYLLHGIGDNSWIVSHTHKVQVRIYSPHSAHSPPLPPHSEIGGRVVRMSQQPHLFPDQSLLLQLLPARFTVPKLLLKSWFFLSLIWWVV